MRDGYFVPPIQLVRDLLIRELAETPDAELHDLSWQLELLLLDIRIPERDWRHTAAYSLNRLLTIIQRRGAKASSLEALVSELAV